MRTRFATLLMGGAGLLPGIAGAQITQKLDRTFATPARSMVLTVSNDIFYDTNVARGSDAAAKLRGIRNEDVRTTPTAAIDVVIPQGRSLFTVQGSVGYDAYAHNSGLNRERVSIRSKAAVPAAFCAIAPEVAYARRQIDLFDLGIIPDAIDASGKNLQTVQEASSALACGPQIGIRPGAHIGYVNTQTDSSGRRSQDVREIRYGSELNYVHPSVGIVTLFARRREFTYDRARQFFPGRLSELSVTNAGLRLDRRLGARLQFNGAVSYADLSSSVNPPGARNFDGLNWDLSATLRIGGRLLLSAASDRGITISPGFSAESIRQTSHSGSLSYAVTPLVRLSAAVSRAERDFRLVATPIGFGITRDRLDAATIRLDYARQQLNVSLRGSYQRRDSDNDLFDFKGAQAVLSVGYTFKR